MSVALIMTGIIAFYTAHSEPMLSAIYMMQNHNIIDMTALTAFDTKRLKDMYEETQYDEVPEKIAIM